MKTPAKLLIAYFLPFTVLVLVVVLTPRIQRFHIHDRTAFWMVGSLGILQTVIALYGGYLALLALPSEKQSKVRGWVVAEKQSKVHGWVVIAVVGLGLFALTIAVGVLNDHSQFELTAKLDVANGALGTVVLNKGGLTDEDRSYISRVLAFTTSPKKSSVPAPSAPAPTAPSPTLPNAPSPTSGPLATTPPDRNIIEATRQEAVRQTLYEEMTTLTEKLENLNSTAQVKRARIATVVGKGRNGMNSSPMDSKTIQDLTAIDDSESHIYLTELLPQIKAVRDHVRRVYATTKTAADDQQFEAANKVASSPGHIPQNLFELFEYRGGKMNLMNAYLSSLKASMSAAVLLHPHPAAPPS